MSDFNFWKCIESMTTLCGKCFKLQLYNDNIYPQTNNHAVLECRYCGHCQDVWLDGTVKRYDKHGNVIDKDGNIIEKKKLSPTK